MQATLKLPLQFDVQLMLSELASIESRRAWLVHPDVTVSNKGDWTAIALISSTGESQSAESLRYHGEDGDARPTELLQSSPYFQEVLSAFHAPVHRARLMSLLPGTVIKEHRDYGAQRYSYERGYVRVHIPIRTDEKVAWRIRGEKVPMMPGEAWYINVCEPHSVENHSAINRVHLVLDMKVNQWLKDLFPPASLWDHASSLVLKIFEPSCLRVRSGVERSYHRCRQFLGDLGLRRLKHRLLGRAAK
jgi:hypothetical protein